MEPSVVSLVSLIVLLLDVKIQEILLLITICVLPCLLLILTILPTKLFFGEYISTAVCYYIVADDNRLQ